MFLTSVRRAERFLTQRVCPGCVAGSVYDYYFQKQGPGQWNMWTDSVSKEDSIIPPGANVRSPPPWMG